MKIYKKLNEYYKNYGSNITFQNDTEVKENKSELLAEFKDTLQICQDSEQISTIKELINDLNSL